MRTILRLAIIATISLTACNKGNNNPVVIDEYYVKYEVNSSTIYSGVKLNATITDEKNNTKTIIIDARSSWGTIIGPVKKGFKATLNVTCPTETYGQLRLYTQISVSKNSSPFALKKIDGSDTPRNSVQIDYTIDY
ncbi:MAG: hypothetical protein J7539_13335 [Niabella sp.]|nr:hypothetical protein [Niabella sp.]